MIFLKILKKIYHIFLFIILSLISIILAFYAYAFFSKPLDLDKNNNFIIYDSNNNAVETSYIQNKWVKLDDVSLNFINAIVSVEDKSFYNHHGFDYIRIVKALYKNFTKNQIVEGASTISQQYIKNAFLDFDKTWSRKIKEAFLTINIEAHYSKNEILEAYINTINYGNGNYGILKASKYYFNKKPSELSLEEAIVLAGIPKSPNNYNPENNLDKCLNRAKTVAKALYNNNLISENDYNNLDFNNINVIKHEDNNSNLMMLKYYEDAILNELNTIDIITDDMLKYGNLKIYTELNIGAQKSMEENILKYIKNDELQVASIIVNPNNGGVMALSGGINYKQSEYNRALYSKRQVGSSMKPFLYYAALENGMTSSSKFLSQETNFVLSNNTIYSPKNNAEKYANKEITMASALAYSDNIYAVKTNMFLGTDKLVNVAKKCGITENLQNNPSLALGTNEINIIDFAKGYTTFASGGYKKNIHFISKIMDNENNVIYEYKDVNDLILNPNYVYILNEMMTATYNPAFVDYTTPTVISIDSKLKQKVAVKSGTTNTDSITVGYNKNALMIIWSGFDDNRDINIPIGNNLKNIFANTINSIEDGTTDNWYSMPQNVVGKLLNAVDGEKPIDPTKAAMYYYLKGTE